MNHWYNFCFTNVIKYYASVSFLTAEVERTGSCAISTVLSQDLFHVRKIVFALAQQVKKMLLTLVGHLTCYAQVSFMYNGKFIKWKNANYLNRHVIWFCCTFVFASLDAIYCGNEEATYLSCDDCPRTNGTTSDNWCSGNCKFDETYQICKEGNS